MTRDTRIDPTVSVAGQPTPLAEECEDEIIRIVQESLTNTIKHANASRFEVKLLFEPHRTQLLILDDGKGFDRFDRTYRTGVVAPGRRAA